MTESAPLQPAVEGRNAEASVGAVLDRLRTVRARFVVPLLLGFIMLFDSWDSISIAFVMPAIVKEWHLNAGWAGGLISVGYAGQFIGAIFLGGLAERMGRMPVFIGAVLLMGILAIACAFSPNYEVLFVVRLVQGIAIGGALPVSITYVNELAPSATRGRYFAIFQFITMAGYAAASFSSAVVIPAFGWRWLFAMGAIPLVLLPLVVILLPESPRWLARMGRMTAARLALRKLGDSAPELDGFPAELPPTEKVASVPIATLFNAEFRRRTVIVMLIWFFTSFASFGLTTWVPSIYVSVFHFPLALALRFTATASLLFLVMASTIAVIIDIVGRRAIAITGSLAATLALLSIGVFLPTSPIILVPLVIVGQLGIYAGSIIAWPYTAETYPTQVRAVALGTCSSIARAASTLTPVVVGVILGSGVSVAVVFGLFGICAVAALAIWLTSTRETAKLKLDAI